MPAVPRQVYDHLLADYRRLIKVNDTLLAQRDEQIRGLEQRLAEKITEIKRLRGRLAESEAECDQWQKKLTDDAWPEIERLHGIEQKFNAYVQDTFRDAQRREAEIERLQAEVDMWHRHYAGLLNEAHDENERLRAALAEACDEIESWVDSDDETTTAWRHLLARDMEC